MIISHRYRYIFVEIPLTASWSVRDVLSQHYEGEPIFHKHATFREFSRTASEEQKTYFVFGAVRNPLEVLVSRYVKIQQNFKQAFSNPEIGGSKSDRFL